MLTLQNDSVGALEASSKALALGEGLIAEDPVNADYRRALVLSYSRMADSRPKSDAPRALEDFRRAVALEEELLGADPANALVRKDLASLHKRIAEFLANLEDNSEALLHFRKASDIFEKVASDAPADLPSRFRAATCRAGGATMLARLGEKDSALEDCRKAMALFQEISEDHTHQILRAEGYEYLGYAYRALATSPKATSSESKQHMNTARDMFQQSLNVLDDLRRRGMLQPKNERYAQSITAEMAKCDAPLAK